MILTFILIDYLVVVYVVVVILVVFVLCPCCRRRCCCCRRRGLRRGIEIVLRNALEIEMILTIQIY